MLDNYLQKKESKELDDLHTVLLLRFYRVLYHRGKVTVRSYLSLCISQQCEASAWSPPTAPCRITLTLQHVLKAAL